MTPKDVQERLERIRSRAHDAEVAHGREDDLHRDVLRAIAEGNVAPGGIAEVAQLALSSQQIRFSRWYAYGAVDVGLLAFAEREGLKSAYRRALRSAEIGLGIAVFLWSVATWYGRWDLGGQW